MFKGKLSSNAEILYLGTQAREVYKADLSILDLEHSPDALPITCFNYVQDGDETGVDTGGSCVPADGEYDYGLIYDEKEPEFTGDSIDTNNVIKPPITEGPSEGEDITDPITDEPDLGFIDKISGFNALQIIIGLLVVSSFIFYTYTANKETSPFIQ